MEICLVVMLALIAAEEEEEEGAGEATFGCGVGI